MAVFAYLAVVLGVVFWLASLKRFRKVFKFAPPIIFAYFVPTLSTTFGITPAVSPVYDWMSRFLLPVALLLLMITVDVGSILRLGRTTLVMMLAGTLGIVIGGPVAYLVFGRFLPPTAWQGMAALSGSWIGGTSNMVAVAESVGASSATLGPIIVVDAVMSFGWMGVLLFLSAYQARFDRWNRADTAVLEEANRRAADRMTERRPAELWHIMALVGLGFGIAYAAVSIGEHLPDVGDPTIISSTTWAVLIVVTGGLLLSFTPVRRLEEVGASRLGYAAMYLLLAGIGAQADLRAVLDAPLYVAAGALWITVHVVVLIIVARLIRAPLFFFATGSMANIGGSATAPIVASVYNPSMAAVGLLMAVMGNVLGIYAAFGCAWMLARLAG